MDPCWFRMYETFVLVPLTAAGSRQASRSVRAVLVALLLAVATLPACGSGVVLISFNSGIVASDPLCGPSGGNFDLREQGGLVVLVVISDRTRIYARSGAPALCDDILIQDPVDVRGTRDGSQLNAQEIYLR